jgi:pilus assembly protein Flp/PilA
MMNLTFLPRTVFNKARGRWVDFLRKEDGPTAVEYAVMLALVIVVCFVAVQIVGANTNRAFGTIGSSLAAYTGS